MINLLLRIMFTIHAGYSMKGGLPTQQGEFLYIASIRKVYSHYCSGIIIHKQHVITAAHRISTLTIEELSVVAGTNVASGRWAKLHPVKEVHLHPGFEEHRSTEQWDNSYFNHDIAVLRLEQSLNWEPFLPPASLMDTEQAWNNHPDCLLISWNVPSDGRKPIILKGRLITLMGNEVHQQWAKYLGEDQRFFNDYSGIAAIGTEDLGSPIVCGNSIAGLVIKGEQVKIPEKPSVVMSITPYVEFIDDIIHDGLFEAKPGEFPYVVAIYNNDIYACGGFIVDATHVATAGHCVITYGIGNFTVFVGYPPQRFSLTDVKIHPNYGLKTTDVPPNWYIDHDFALLTLNKPILWNQRTSPLPLTDSDNFHVEQVCELLRWKYHKDEKTGAEWIKLMTSRVMILNTECSQPQLDPSPQSQVPSFWGKSRYLIPIADHKDVGNPIICDGNPVGFLIQAIPFNGKSTTVVARFLKIRPYIESSNSLWYHDV